RSRALAPLAGGVAPRLNAGISNVSKRKDVARGGLAQGIGATPDNSRTRINSPHRRCARPSAVWQAFGGACFANLAPANVRAIRIEPSFVRRAMHHFAYRAGVLHAEDVSLDRVAAEIGTPFYCYST